MARLCPECSTEMRGETVHGVQLDVCPKCAGIWFDAEELRTLLARDSRSLIELTEVAVPEVEQKAGDASTRHCPDDHSQLQQYHYLYNSPVVLDTCPQCGGFFVEKNELSKMQQWLDETHKPITKQEEDALAIANFTIAHDNEMIRQENIRRLFKSLGTYRPGWFGLIP